jgi:hypothetical protein
MKRLLLGIITTLLLGGINAQTNVKKFTMVFTRPNKNVVKTSSLTKDYVVVKISGTLRTNSANGDKHWIDAFYGYASKYRSLTIPKVEWKMNEQKGFESVRLYPPFYDTNHTYEVCFKNPNKDLEFTFDDNYYGDNAGSLKFEVFTSDIGCGCECSDTTKVIIRDTVTTNVFDTTTITQHDTVIIPRYREVKQITYDTTELTVYDTITTYLSAVVTKTVIVKDTVKYYQNSNNDTLIINWRDKVMNNHKIKITQIKVYPNPATSNLIISVPDAVNEMFIKSVSLVSVNGQTTKKLFILREPETEIKLDVNGLSSGMYILSLVDNNNFVITKMVQIVK